MTPKARVKELEAEIERLQEIISKEPHTAYLEAVQRACDERLQQYKHEIRDLTARVKELEAEIEEVAQMAVQYAELVTPPAPAQDVKK